MIGTQEQAVAEAVRECVTACLGMGPGDEPNSRDMKLGLSRKSGGGKYVSWSLQLRVDSQAERDALFSTLADHPAIKMVI
ncbi:MAG: DUF493 domain-containing protein [Gemmatimonadales bacterium]|nr:DUF493 domain-containing protein [Gemmatimonadales bacterium]